MYHTDPLTFNSVLKDIPARKLPESILQNGENIIFDNGVIRTRYGVSDFGSESLNDNITGISLYKKLRKTDRFIVAFTNRDIYVYNPSKGIFNLKTRNYNTGRVTTSGSGNKTVTLTGGTWQGSWNQFNLYQISFDSATMENCINWYTVESITDTEHIKLVEEAPVITSSAYCLRLCYAGDSDDSWHTCYPYSNNSQDRIILATNGIDIIQQWDSTGYFKDFTAYPHRAKFVGFFGSVGWEHVVFANYFDTGSQTSFEQTMQWLDAGGDLAWSGNYAELLDSTDPITGIVPLAGRLMIYKSGSISIADINPVGGNAAAYFIQQNIVEFGTPAIRTVCNIGTYHIIFTGNDIRKFDGHNFDIISEGNTQFIVNNLNKEYQHRAFAFILPEQSLYCLFLPFKPSKYCNICLVYNYKTGSWSYWTMKDLNGNTLYPMSKGKYSRTYAPTWQSLILSPTGNLIINSNQIQSVYPISGIEIGMKVTGDNIPEESYITNITGSVISLNNNSTATVNGVNLKIGWTAAQMEQRWTDLIVDERYTRILLGDANGNLYNYSIDFNNDNNNSIDSGFTTKDYDLNRAGFDFRLLECTLALQLKDGFTPAVLDIRASIDFGRNWTSWNTVPLDGNQSYMEKKVNFNIVGKQARFEIRMSNPLVFESMTIGFNAQYKSMKFDN
ncbi:MAG: hypothetical protein CVV49_00610 [Spirochaetae bacterium HGW-Spirochaetae-5]|nr:MAG: hypothetical protein CVV49_00610 [Spirochaetae bacterium HGW-Spirochaetae-5]